jgi:3-phosphoglycerate kinase
MHQNHFYKKTVRDLDLHGKTVLLRADFNVPVDDNGHVTSDYRISQTLPTIEYLLAQNAKVIIISHLGRPKSADDISCSLFPVAKRLQQLLKRQVNFVPDCVGPRAEKIIGTLKQGDVALLENLRFHPEEEQNDHEFAKQLAGWADVFVQDGFGVVHRAHASTDAVTNYIPSVAGLLLEKEVGVIAGVMHNPVRPMMAIVGGAKISDKLDVLHKMIDIADFVAVGGAMANTFLKAEGIKVGDSLVEDKSLGLAREVIAKARAKAKKQYFIFYLPQDGVVAKKIDSREQTRIVDWSSHVIAGIESYPKRPPHHAGQVMHDEKILDIGPFSASFISGAMQLANTVVWNGTMGVTETESLLGPVGPFAQGTELIIEAATGQLGHRPFSVVGGGDTVGYIESRRLTDMFNHVSTGGGASLDLMTGRKLPGVEALLGR